MAIEDGGTPEQQDGNQTPEKSPLKINSEAGVTSLSGATPPTTEGPVKPSAGLAEAANAVNPKAADAISGLNRK